MKRTDREGERARRGDKRRRAAKKSCDLSKSRCVLLLSLKRWYGL